MEPPTDVRTATGRLEASPVDSRVERRCTPWAKAPAVTSSGRSRRAAAAVSVQGSSKASSLACSVQ
eukprot:5629674-Alexandrium_andersonii.AAC.1